MDDILQQLILQYYQRLLRGSVGGMGVGLLPTQSLYPIGAYPSQLYRAAPPSQPEDDLRDLQRLY